MISEHLVESVKVQCDNSPSFHPSVWRNFCNVSTELSGELLQPRVGRLMVVILGLVGVDCGLWGCGAVELWSRAGENVR